MDVRARRRAMYERICERCRRVCFTPEQFENHECFDYTDMLDAEIALANWDGKLFGEPRAEAEKP
jgi:hypothetical protein